jgi:hypothetical protein
MARNETGFLANVWWDENGADGKPLRHRILALHSQSVCGGYSPFLSGSGGSVNLALYLNKPSCSNETTIPQKISGNLSPGFHKYKG